MDRKVEAAKRAIDRVADDRGADLRDILDNLDELQAHLDGCMAGIRDDIAREEND